MKYIFNIPQTCQLLRKMGNIGFEAANNDIEKQLSLFRSDEHSSQLNQISKTTLLFIEKNTSWAVTGLEWNQSVRDPQSGRIWAILWCHRKQKPPLSDFCTPWHRRPSTFETLFRDSMTGKSNMSCGVLGAIAVSILRKPQSPWDRLQLLTRFLMDRCRLMLAYRALSCNCLLGFCNITINERVDT